MVTNITTFEGELPDENDPSTFKDRAQSFVQWMAGQLAPELKTSIDEMNALSGLLGQNVATQACSFQATLASTGTRRFHLPDGGPWLFMTNQVAFSASSGVAGQLDAWGDASQSYASFGRPEDAKALFDFDDTNRDGVQLDAGRSDYFLKGIWAGG